MASHGSINIERLFAPPSARPAPAARRTHDSRAGSPPATKVLTPTRPILSQLDRQVSPSRGTHDMNDTKTAPSGELITLHPALRGTRLEFLMLDRALTALAKRGSNKCRKVMHRIDRSLGQAAEDGFSSTVASDDHCRALVRARCRLCPSRCREPVL